jgi:proline iminopeptidase
MKKHIINSTIFKLIFIFMLFSWCIYPSEILTAQGEQHREPGQFWPPSQPYKTGYLKVSDIHSLFYQLGGNPKAQPVIVLHGGPGSGCTPKYFRLFNPEKFHVILHDQRGAAKSTPFAELKDNTTQHLVEDIEKLRQHLGLGKVILFGGSWGSTLALAYAETYPHQVSGMILRGIFTATKAEIDHFYHCGTADYFPENFKKVTDLLGPPTNKDFPSQFLKKLQSKDKDTVLKYARAWTVYELKIALLDISDTEVETFIKNWNPIAFATIENFYMVNKCFLKEGQLFNNAYKLKDIPTFLINGRYDVICPPKTAYKLHKLLPKSQLIIAEASGHSSQDKNVRIQLIEAIKTFEK